VHHADCFCSSSQFHGQLTSAGCLDSQGAPPLLRFNSNLLEEGGTVVGVTGSVVHPDYAPDGFYGDNDNIAILMLNETLTLDTVSLNNDPSVPAESDPLYSTCL
jgi:hypothetical protein